MPPSMVNSSSFLKVIYFDLFHKNGTLLYQASLKVLQEEHAKELPEVVDERQRLKINCIHNDLKYRRIFLAFDYENIIMI